MIEYLELIIMKPKINVRQCRNKLFFIICSLLFSVAFASCADDKEGMGTPEITAVRTTDPAKADSTFLKASAGQMLAVMGRNLSEVTKVYINDQEVGFNSTMNTSTSIIVTVPTEENGFLLTTFNPGLKDEIRVETTHGTATYAFKITAPSPQLTLLQARYPRKAGDQLNIMGYNLVDVEKVYFTDLTSEQLDTTAWTTIGGTHTDVQYEVVSQNHYLNSSDTYLTASQLRVTIPSLGYDTGTLVVETAAGTSYYPFSFYLKPPTITGVNTDMPVPGEVLHVYGTYFVQVEAVKYGDVTLTDGDYTVAESEDQIDIVFAKKPSEGSGSQLTVVTGGGEVSVPFYDYSTLLVDFDGRGTDNGWDPKASVETTDGTAAPYTADGQFAHISVEAEGTQWWGTAIFFRKDWNGPFDLPGYDVIPADAPASDIYLASEVYDNNSDYNNGEFNGYLRYVVWPTGLDTGNTDNQYDWGFGWVNYDEQTAQFDQPVLCDINGKAWKQQWYRHVVSLDNFACYKGKTYAEIVALGLENFRIQSINQGSPNPGRIDVCFDNIRLFYKKN